MNYLVPHAMYPSRKNVCINGAPAYMNLIVFVVFCLIGPCNLITQMTCIFVIFKHAAGIHFRIGV